MAAFSYIQDTAMRPVYVSKFHGSMSAVKFNGVVLKIYSKIKIRHYCLIFNSYNSKLFLTGLIGNRA